jgi:CRP-like cAMP-binding protein
MEGFDFGKDTEELLFRYKQSLSLKKGQVLISQGQQLVSLFEVKSGLLREYFQEGESEFTASFILEDNFYFSGFFLGRRVKSSFIVEAMEDTNLEALDFGFFEDLASQPIILLEILGHIFYKKYQQDLDWKLINGKKTFLERWEYFNQRFPGLWLRIPQRSLASFFNVTPQYISKLKAKRLL